jgi:hypothetical protein
MFCNVCRLLLSYDFSDKYAEILIRQNYATYQIQCPPLYRKSWARLQRARWFTETFPWLAPVHFRLRFSFVVALYDYNPSSLQRPSFATYLWFHRYFILNGFHMLAFILLFNVFENFSQITLKFPSASSSNNVHSAGEKFDFRGRLFTSVDADMVRNFLITLLKSNT